MARGDGNCLLDGHYAGRLLLTCLGVGICRGPCADFLSNQMIGRVFIRIVEGISMRSGKNENGGKFLICICKFNVQLLLLISIVSI